MPYYVHPVSLPVEGLASSHTLIAYASAARAHRLIAVLKSRSASIRLRIADDYIKTPDPHGNPYRTIYRRVWTRTEPIAVADLRVTFQASYEERATWQSRERSRFNDGTYMHVPWRYAGADDAQIETVAAHYAHVSIKTPGMIAFTENDEKGIADRQTMIRPGRYLERFYSETDADTRAQWIAECSIDHLALSVTNDPAEIERVYSTGSPTSCMAHPASNYAGHCHPVRAYGGPHSDLALAYLGSIDDGITARAIVWPERKEAGRIYGDVARMKAVLRAHDYACVYGSGSFAEGARITAIKDRNGNGYVMPYVDGIGTCELTSDGRSFILGEGDVDCQTTDGVTDSCAFTCDQCNGRYASDDDYAGNGRCNDCASNDVTCDRCDGTFNPDDESMTELQDGSSFCESCASRMTVTCAIDDCDETWIEREEFTRAEIRTRDRDETASLCRDCASNHHRCEDCGDTWISDDADRQTCEDCTVDDDPESPDTLGEPIRCAHTIDLLADITPIYRLEHLREDGSWNACVFATPLQPQPIAESNDRAIVEARMIELQDIHPDDTYRIHTIYPATCALAIDARNEDASCEIR